MQGCSVESSLESLHISFIQTYVSSRLRGSKFDFGSTQDVILNSNKNIDKTRTRMTTRTCDNCSFKHRKSLISNVKVEALLINLTSKYNTPTSSQTIQIN